MFFLCGCGSTDDKTPEGYPIFHSVGESQEAANHAQELTAPVFAKISSNQPLNSLDIAQLQEAAKIYEGLTRFQPDYGPYFALGQIYQALGENEKTVSRLRQFFELAPEKELIPGQFADAHGLIAAALFELQKYSEVVSELDPVIAKEPRADLLIIRGRAKLQLGQIKEAHADFEQAYVLQPDEPRLPGLLKLTDPQNKG
jgi:tetratricopeptide (TPR) repeat protein